MPTITFLAASNIPVAVAVDRNTFSGIKVKYQQVGDDQETSLFLGGSAEVGAMSPWSVAEFDSQGEKLKVISSVGAKNFLNGVLIRSADASKYKTVADLKGQKLAISGVGSDTFAAFQSYVKTKYGLDAKKDFDLVTASAGAALGLLATGQVAGALTLSGPTATGMADPKYKLIYSFSAAWKEDTGQPLIIDALTAKDSWADAHPDQVQDFIDGVQKALDWMKKNPQAFNAGGKYAKLAEGEGWIANGQATSATPEILKLMASGQWYLDASTYTSKLVQADYKFVKEGAGTLFKGSTPSVDTLFYNPPGQ